MKLDLKLLIYVMMMVLILAQAVVSQVKVKFFTYEENDNCN